MVPAPGSAHGRPQPDAGDDSSTPFIDGVGASEQSMSAASGAGPRPPRRRATRSSSRLAYREVSGRERRRDATPSALGEEVHASLPLDASPLNEFRERPASAWQARAGAVEAVAMEGPEAPDPVGGRTRHSYQTRARSREGPPPRLVSLSGEEDPLGEQSGSEPSPSPPRARFQAYEYGSDLEPANAISSSSEEETVGSARSGSDSEGGLVIGDELFSARLLNITSLLAQSRMRGLLQDEGGILARVSRMFRRSLAACPLARTLPPDPRGDVVAALATPALWPGHAGAKFEAPWKKSGPWKAPLRPEPAPKPSSASPAPLAHPAVVHRFCFPSTPRQSASGAEPSLPLPSSSPPDLHSYEIHHLRVLRARESGCLHSALAAPRIGAPGFDPGVRRSLASARCFGASVDRRTVVDRNLGRAYVVRHSEGGAYCAVASQTLRKIRVYDAAGGSLGARRADLDAELRWTVTDLAFDPGEAPRLLYSTTTSVLQLATFASLIERPEEESQGEEDEDARSPSAGGRARAQPRPRRGWGGSGDVWASSPVGSRVARRSRAPPPDTQTPIRVAPEAEHGYSSAVWAVRWGRQRGEALVGTSECECLALDLETRRVTARAGGHARDVNSVEYVDEGEALLLSGSDDACIRLWDRRMSSRELRPAALFEGHTEGVAHLHSRRDGRLFLSNAKDQSARIWDLRKPSSGGGGGGTGWRAGVRDAALGEEASGMLENRPASPRPSASSRPPTGAPPRRTPAAGPRLSFEWDYRWMGYPAQGRRMEHPRDASQASFYGHSVLQTLVRAYWSPPDFGQSCIYAGSADGICRVWEATGKPVASLLGGGDDVLRDCSWHPHWPTIVTASFNGDVVIHDLVRCDRR